MRHIPVLLEEVIEGLNLKPGMNAVDCTVGDGGHSEKILQAIGPKGRLMAIDADPEAILQAKQYLYQFSQQIFFVRENFVNLSKIVQENKFEPINAILIDLGWSSPQFEERGRGFSFLKDEKLDMRYDGSSKLQITNSKSTAADIVNTLSEEELNRIFQEYGEEKLSKEIAKAIVIYRRDKKIEQTGQLVEIILDVYRQKLKSNKEIPWIGGLHPATKVFQALRIAVNDELGVLEKVLPQLIEVLSAGGRLGIISFHSLEDRIVKHYFKSQENKLIKIITKKPIICSEEECKQNPRACSAKLRVIERK